MTKQNAKTIDIHYINILFWYLKTCRKLKAIVSVLKTGVTPTAEKSLYPEI